MSDRHADRSDRPPGAPQALGRPRVDTQDWTSALAGGGAIVLVAWMAFESGGYFPSGYLPAGAVAWGLCGFVLLVRPRSDALSATALAGLGALALFAVWTGLSTTWSLNESAGLEDLHRNLAYVALFCLGLIGASGRHAASLVRIAGAVALVIVLAGLWRRLLPEAADAVPPGYRLDHPLTYWNAFGALAAMTAVLGLGLASDHREHAIVRGAAAGGSVLAGVAMYFTLSRGAWLALAVGILALLIMSRRRPAVVLTTLIAGGLFTVALLRLRGYPSLVDDPSAGAGRVAEGRDYLPQLLGLTAVAAALQALVAMAPSEMMERTRGFGDGMRRRMPYIAGLAAAAALVAGLAAWNSVGDRFDQGGEFIEEQWDDLTATSTSEVGSGRLTNARGPRGHIYTIAFEGWLEHPIAGDGAGSFRVRWARERELDEDLVNAHSVFLETLSDTGLVGLLALGAFMASLIVAVRRAVHRPKALSSSATAAVAAAVLVWAVHAAIDWDWQMPALTGLALVLAATIYPTVRPQESATSTVLSDPPQRRWALRFGALRSRTAAFGGLLLAGYLALAAHDAIRVRDGTRALERGDQAAAADHVRDVVREPAAAQAAILRAFAARGQRDPAAAERAFADAVDRTPNDWALRRERATNLLELGQRDAARRELVRALDLNPRMPVPPELRR